MLALAVGARGDGGGAPRLLHFHRMCGRFSLTVGDRDIAEQWNVRVPFDVPARYNIAPSQPVVALRADGGRRVDEFRWGLVPHWAKDPEIGNRMINARAETLFEKPAFRAAAMRRRCLVLADGFYEWKRTNGKKQPYYVRLKSGRPFGFAGIWEHWEGAQGELRTCSIVTTEPNELMMSIHDRMPVVVRKDLEDLWLDPEIHDTAELGRVLQPFPDDEMEAHPVSTIVNNPDNDVAECVKPATRQDPLF